MEKIFKELSKLKNINGVFNPWFEYDVENDMNNKSYFIRRENLEKYLDERKQAKYLFLGEALGYQGGHFTGIAMTSERILLGHLTDKNIFPYDVFYSDNYIRTSKPILKKSGFTEPTATIVWQYLKGFKVNTRDVVIWNAFAWHPYKPEKGFLSNRTPSKNEMYRGKDVLEVFLSCFDFKVIISIGEKSFRILNDLGVSSQKVRHPANGGASIFREQLNKIL